DSAAGDCVGCSGRGPYHLHPRGQAAQQPAAAASDKALLSPLPFGQQSVCGRDRRRFGGAVCVAEPLGAADNGRTGAPSPRCLRRVFALPERRNFRAGGARRHARQRAGGGAGGGHRAAAGARAARRLAPAHVR
ncbi:hypothetical protein EMIHUDRAFT_374319, partial [Emiliania huxleyi CCMP1516]|uniref:Uncharacterized protein n=2 Tax=Emiliania huxleyi TaxID=2903 RepID=A0A0D3IJ09_EMIH1